MTRGIKQSEKLAELVSQCKKRVMDWDSVWAENITGFVSDTNFIYMSTNTPQDLQMLEANNQPQIQFNITKPYVTREISKFMEMQPSFVFKIKDGFPVTKEGVALSNMLKNYFAATYRPSENNYAFSKARRDCVAGGWSALYVYPDYINDHTTEQKVYIRKSANSCLVGFDPTADHITKRDGDYAFEKRFTKLSEIRREYGKKAAELCSDKQGRAQNAYAVKQAVYDETLCVVYFYYKEWYKETIVKLSNGMHATEADALAFISRWKPGKLDVKITIVETREVDRYKICKLVYAENGYVLEHDKNTLWNELPLIYMDGESQELATDSSGMNMRQVTSSIIRQAIDIQRTKNAMGQAIVASTQNIGVTRWLVSRQAMPDKIELQNAYTDPDAARVVIWNEVDPKNPDARLTPPREVDFPGAKPEQLQMFSYMDTLFQSAMATFDPSTPSISRNDMSGKAIYAGDAQAQMISQPGMLGVTAAMAQAAKIELHLMTQLIKDPRQLPQMTNGSKVEHTWVNTPGGISMDFDAAMFSIEVTPGVSTELQKSQALDSILTTAKLLPTVAQFCDDPETIPLILRLIPGANLDSFIVAYDTWLEKQKQKPQQPNPQVMQAQTDQMKAQTEAKNVQVKELQTIVNAKLKERDQNISLLETVANVLSQEQKDDVGAVTALAKVDQADTELELEKQQTDAENTRSALDALVAMKSDQREDEKHEMAKQMHVKAMTENDKTEAE